MPGFSLSAPVFTPEQERAELEVLSQDDLQKLHADAYGCNCFTAVTTKKMMTTNEDETSCTSATSTSTTEKEHEEGEEEETLDRARRLVLEAMDTLVPEHRTQEYLEATRRCPTLVATESDPAKFYRCEEGHAGRAAQRLAYYWKGRVQIFGSDKAFLPLTLQSAALVDEAPYLEQGVVMSAGRDRCGRPVNVFDLARTHTLPRAAVVRLMMYILTVQAEEQQQQQGQANNINHAGVLIGEQRQQQFGYVAMHRLQGFEPYKHSDRVLSKQIMMVVDGAPIVCKITHMRTGTGRIIRDVLLPVFKHIIGAEHRLRLKLYAGTDEETARELRTYGLAEEQIQILLGPVERVRERGKKFLRERRALEDAEADVGGGH